MYHRHLLLLHNVLVHHHIEDHPFVQNDDNRKFILHSHILIGNGQVIIINVISMPLPKFGKKTSIYKSPAYRQYLLLLSYEINIKKCNQHQSYLHPKTHKKKKSVGVYNNNNRISCDYYCVIISHSLSFIHSFINFQ